MAKKSATSSTPAPTTTTTNKKASKSTKPVVEPAPVVAEPVKDTTVDDTTVDDTEDELVNMTSSFMAKFQTLSTGLASLRSDFRVLEKAWTKRLKAAEKVGAKKKKRQVARQPSGFVKPTLISKELAAFLEKPNGTEMARTEVTRDINAYIRKHQLQDKENGRQINPDKKLSALLKLPSGETLTYFNLQRFMSPHFAKAGQAGPAANMSQ